jgi:hypothetical protein
MLIPLEGFPNLEKLDPKQCQIVLTDKILCTNLAVETKIVDLPPDEGRGARISVKLNLCAQHAKILDEVRAL